MEWAAFWTLISQVIIAFMVGAFLMVLATATVAAIKKERNK